MELLGIKKFVAAEVAEMLQKEQIEGFLSISRVSIHLYDWLESYRFSVEGIYKGHNITAEASSQLQLVQLLVTRIKEKVITNKFNQNKV